jgi:DNA-binding NtrC family response regulator
MTRKRPIDPGRLQEVLARGLTHEALAARLAAIEEQLDERLGFERLSGRSRALQRVMEQVRQIAATRATVLIEGEPGTGKGLVAQAIHQHGPRRHEPFVRIDCAAGAAVLEGELFGRDVAEGGAATAGRLELADGGTLLLDEIGAAPAGVQVRLLRVLQDRTFERVGGGVTLTSDARIIAATSVDLVAEVAAGRFRADLHSRLVVVRIAIPPLRQHADDVPLLVEGFIRDANAAHGRRVTGITRGALDRLAAHDWPGNVRELRNVVEAMVAFARGRRALDLSDLPDALRGADAEFERLELAVGMTVEEAERRLIAATLRHTGGDKPRAAGILGIGLRTLYRKIAQYGMPQGTSGSRAATKPAKRRGRNVR